MRARVQIRRTSFDRSRRAFSFPALRSNRKPPRDRHPGARAPLQGASYRPSARASATRSGRACAGTSRCALRTEGSQAGTRSKKAHVSGFSPSLAATCETRLGRLGGVKLFPRRDDSRSALALAHRVVDPPAASPRARSSARCVAAASPRARRARAVGRTGSFVSEPARFASMPERQRAGHRRTGIAARASSRWTESDRAALELARTRVSAALAASEGSKRPAASDRPAGSSRSSRAPGRIFRHTIKEAFREWLFERERERVSVTRPTKPPLPNPNAEADEKNLSRTASNAEYSHGIPDVSVATKTKVRAWVEARRAETRHATPTRESLLPPRDVQTEESRVFVSTNHLTAARVSTDQTSHAPSSRVADYVVKCTHLAFPNVTGGEKPGADEHGWPGYFEKDTGRFVPAFCARRVACRFENAEEEEAFLFKQRTRNATFVFCQNCHDAFLVRELTRCDSRTSACHACGVCVPRSATTKDGGAEGKPLCVFCAFAAKARDSEKKKKRVDRDERETERETDAVAANVANGLSRTESDSCSFSGNMNRPACAFLDADDVPGLDALRAAVAKDAPGRVFLRWDAVARRARNAETDARWRVSSRESNLRGDARLIYARPRSATPETDAPVNWGFLHAGMPKPFAADDFPARHAREFY